MISECSVHKVSIKCQQNQDQSDISVKYMIWHSVFNGKNPSNNFRVFFRNFLLSRRYKTNLFNICIIFDKKNGFMVLNQILQNEM